MSAEHRGCYWCRFRPLSKYLFEPIRYRFPNLGADMRKILLAIAAAGGAAHSYGSGYSALIREGREHGRLTDAM